MFDALEDPYSDYMDVVQAEQFNSDLSSSFQGIGAEIQERNGNIVVVSPIKTHQPKSRGDTRRYNLDSRWAKHTRYECL